MSVEFNPLQLLTEKTILDAPRTESAKKRQRARMKIQLIALCEALTRGAFEDITRRKPIERVSLPIPVEVEGSPFEARVKVYSERYTLSEGYTRYHGSWGLHLERLDENPDERIMITISTAASVFQGSERARNTVIRNYKGGVATNAQLQEGLDAAGSFQRQLQERLATPSSQPVL